ncbi:HNH endonuclease [Mycoplasmatota bacterium]|nr:HNH endonuclease [Mycoplasmatota bacterium]
MGPIIRREFSDEILNISKISELILGKSYNNYEIINTFQCSEQGGMRRSHKTNTLVIVSDHTKPLYDDRWDEEGVLHYTGMGKSGAMDIDFAQNRTVKESGVNSTEMHLFEVFDSSTNTKYVYRGIIELYAQPYQDNQIGEDGNLRKAWIFPLLPRHRFTVNSIRLKKIGDEKDKTAARMSDEVINKYAKSRSNQPPSKRIARTVIVNRDPIVKEFVKRRANGRCDLCDEDAPFKVKEKIPYLEVHHIIQLADDGPDTIYNAVALCPNCHRKVHYALETQDRVKMLRKLDKYLNNDNDKENKESFIKLFALGEN